MALSDLTLISDPLLVSVNKLQTLFMFVIFHLKTVKHINTSSELFSPSVTRLNISESFGKVALRKCTKQSLNPTKEYLSQFCLTEHYFVVQLLIFHNGS